MSDSSFKIERYSFCDNGVMDLQNNHFAKNQWPVVYLLSGGKKKKKLAYIGESTNVTSRMKAHLSHVEKSELNSLQLISSDKFNKSAALDIESKLIRYIAADGQFDLINSNLGIANHNYYQKNEVYNNIFEGIWDDLRAKGIVIHSLPSLNNSDIFKYSPYKSLSIEQEQGVINILRCLLDNDHDTVIAEGGAGTGKTILAIYLFKLLLSEEPIYADEVEDSSTSILKSLVGAFKKKYPDPKIALVIPMSSFRNTLKKAFRNIKGLKAAMVMSPSEAVKSELDLIVVDESHRLRRRVNLGTYFGGFDKTCKRLELDKHTCSELDWVLMQSKKTVLFYDEMQSIKPSDVLHEDFYKLKQNKKTKTTELKSQFRSRGGNQYSAFIDQLFKLKLDHNAVFSHKGYELLMFESLPDMICAVKECEKHYGLARLVAGFAWPWKSNNDKSVYDINIGDVSLKWNSTNLDWINKKGAIDEVGCIHTTQGYDLNYTGVILGPEISFDPIKNEIVIIEKNYFDKNGKQSIKDPAQLKSYIINIYKTILLRAIRGTYLYACDPELRKYLSRHIAVISGEKAMKIRKPEVMPIHKVKPFVNAIPLYDIKAAAGGFSSQQSIGDLDWIALPDNIQPSEGLFACYVVGESMSKVVPDGSICLFKANPGGSRNGKIVLVQHHSIEDPDHGGTYTVKRYGSEKVVEDGELVNQRILLKPETNAYGYSPIVIEEGEELVVVGEFLMVV
ncbi:hypothetical protein MED121_12720 [Marinomonas sp. MED121]|uniref:DNA/RNA helicase domain-containing protein n=1 Tax=Marinomonas sp. MED121 TaxID=314277 RepID=UPI000068FE7F|nr:DNA/RNA helicase domain-containing protein [Marinomonas sp. MED121]EAQ66790.1 hypothetical protein MED121_12720 [Marinomonas sp. MED121]